MQSTPVRCSAPTTQSFASYACCILPPREQPLEDNPFSVGNSRGDLGVIMLTVTNLNAGLDALGLDKLKSADDRKKEARALYRDLASKGIKPATAITKALEAAMKGITSNRSDRLKTAKRAAGVTMTSAVRQGVTTATSRLPKRKQKQARSTKTPKAKSHWSFADGAMTATVIVFLAVGLSLFAIFAPVIFQMAQAEYGVGAGTFTCSFVLIIILMFFGAIGWFVLNAIRTNRGYDFEAKKRERKHGTTSPTKP
jgi:hypothetical protein